MRYILPVLLLLQISCNRIQNTISVARLNCGSETTLTGSYLRFADTAGNELQRDDIDIRSLDGNDSRRLEVTSKGCLAAQETGLWMVRHKQKLEGLVLKIEEKELSGIRQLQDISHENLKLACPGSDLSATISPLDFVANLENHDQRGYAIHFSVRDEKSEQAIEWPWLNLATTKPTLVGSMIREGNAILNIELKNQFRMGEVDKKSCQVKFDYTAPLTYSSVQRNVPLDYRSRPFYSLDAEENLTFVSEDSDISFYEVCWQKRVDWNNGEILDKDLARCTEVQRISHDKNLNLSERNGFWQLEFRSVDKAGNHSEWSQPQIVLLQQTATIDGMKVKAAKIASIVEAKPVDGAAGAMVLAMELYNSWMNLPTLYERDYLEGVVQLSLHRPWLRDSIRQDLLFQDLPDAMYWDTAWLDGGNKIVSYERNRSDYDDKYMEVKIYDLRDYSSKKLFKVDWEYAYGSAYFVTSEDGKKFIYCVTAASKMWVGELVGDDVRVTELEFEVMPWGARFVDEDRYIVVINESEKLTYDVSNLQREPIRELNLQSHLDGGTLSYDGEYILSRDWEKNVMTWFPISDGNLPTQIIDLPESGITEAETTAFYVVGPNLYLIPVKRDILGPCTLLLAWQNSSGAVESERIAEGAPCDGDLVLNQSRDSALLNLDTERVGSLMMSNLKKFSKSIPFPVKTQVEGGLDSSEGSIQKSISADGKFVAAVYREPEYDARMVIWRRNEAGEYQEHLKFKMDNPAQRSPVILAEDLGLIIMHSYGYLQMVGYLEENAGFQQKYSPDNCDTISAGAYLGKGKLLAACLGGHIEILDISNRDFRLIERVRPTHTTIVHMDYDFKNEVLLMTVKDSTQLWLWPKGDLSHPPTKLGGFKSGIINLSLSQDRRKLATIAVNREDSAIKVFDYNRVNLQPSSLDGHASKVSHVSFFGMGSYLVSGDESGVLKIWDANHPDFPGVTLLMQRGGAIKNLVGIPDRNEFIAENSSQRIYHYRLESIQDIKARTCEFLRPYIHQNSGLTESQKKLCRPR